MSRVKTIKCACMTHKLYLEMWYGVDEMTEAEAVHQRRIRLVIPPLARRGCDASPINSNRGMARKAKRQSSKRMRKASVQP